MHCSYRAKYIKIQPVLLVGIILDINKQCWIWKGIWRRWKALRMNVLSLFDGISCGRIALERAGIKVDKYYSSEIDKYCLKIAEKNYPDNIQLGDVNNWIDWDIEYPDLIIGGSPCQGFSFAGKQLAFDDPRSKLFWQFVALLKFCKPKYFLLENVKMQKKYLDVISDALGVEPILINSSLVSAQNRVRYYWTNISNVTQPEDKGIQLKDILEDNGTGWIKSNKEWYSRNEKSMCLDANYFKGADNHGQRTMIKCVQVGDANIKAYRQRKAVYSKEGKSPTVLTPTGGNHHVKVAIDNKFYRKLTPIECERLQTIPDNWSEGISNTQRYKAIGNAWTVDVIAHIFKHMQP